MNSKLMIFIQRLKQEEKFVERGEANFISGKDWARLALNRVWLLPLLKYEKYKLFLSIFPTYAYSKC